MTSKVVTAIGAALVVFSVAASAQGLGDLAKQEEARRKTVATPGKVYTNEKLRPVESCDFMRFFPVSVKIASQAIAR